jgi:hypothetical protein
MQMESAEYQFQRAFTRYLTDEEFRRLVVSGTEIDCDRWRVNSEALERLRDLNSERTGLFSELLLSNRLAKAQEAFPVTSALLGHEFPRIIKEYNQSVPTKDPRKHAEAKSFGRYLLRRLDIDPVGPTYLGDILLYEMTSLLLRFEFDGNCWTEPEDQSEGLLERLAMRNGPDRIYPHLIHHHQLISFAYRVESICAAVTAQCPLHDIQPQEQMVFLFMAPDSSMQQLEINEPTAALLLTADGETSFLQAVHKIADLFYQSTATDKIYDGCLEVSRGLVEQGCLRLNRRRKQTAPRLLS